MSDKKTKVQRKKLYLRVDEREDAINALEHCAEIASVLAKPANWKWCLISIHNALQGALVCTLSGTDQAGALDDSSFKKWHEWLKASRSNPDLQPPRREKLADLLTLLKRAETKDWMAEFGGKPIAVTPEVRKDIAHLNSLRNDFIHFTPKGWSIELAGLPRILLNACSLIDHLIPIVID